MSSVANILNCRTEGSFWTPSAGEQGQTASQSERANTHRDCFELEALALPRCPRGARHRRSSPSGP